MLIDEDLLNCTYGWAPAGARNALMEMDPKVLPLITDGKVCLVH